jgi:hypothetical protein
MDFVMDALKHDLPIPDNEPIGLFFYFNAGVLSSPLQNADSPSMSLLKHSIFASGISPEPDKIGAVPRGLERCHCR